MTLKEAEEALEQGKTISHRKFSPKWILKLDNDDNIVDELGCIYPGNKLSDIYDYPDGWYVYDEEGVGMIPEEYLISNELCASECKMSDSLKFMVIEAFKKSCPCYPFPQDRKCDNCDRLREFIDLLNKKE